MTTPDEISEDEFPNVGTWGTLTDNEKRLLGALRAERAKVAELRESLEEWRLDMKELQAHSLGQDKYIATLEQQFAEAVDTISKLAPYVPEQAKDTIVKARQKDPR